MRPIRYIAILDIRSGKRTYLTTSEHCAASELKPGTTFGVGETKDGAERAAAKRREFHLGTGY